MRYKDLAFVEYNGVKVSNICYQNVIDIVSGILNNKETGYICLTDVSNLIVASKNEEMRAAINGSLLSLADGMPLVWYARMAGCKEIERISGASLMRGLLKDLSGYSHYLLGDTEHTIARVIEEAKKLNPGIKISGHSPPFREFSVEDDRLMVDRIRDARADIVWVCFGGGKQEKWMNKHFADLDSGVMIGVGAAFRFLIGEIVTPPVIFQKLGLQWLFRLTEAFLKDPVNCVKVVHKRKIMSSKVEYVARFPYELTAARLRMRKNRQ